MKRKKINQKRKKVEKENVSRKFKLLTFRLAEDFSDKINCGIIRLTLMDKSASIDRLMTKRVISVNPESPLMEAVDLLLKHNFNGLPVIDKNGTLLGILTEYDLMINGSSLHLPTFLKLLQQFDIYQKDKKLIRDDIKKILEMKVSDVMNPNPLTLENNCSINEAIETFGKYRDVNPIPIVDGNKKLTGIISRYDLVKLLGGFQTALSEPYSERKLDKNINNFLSHFERQFVLVNRTRTHYWFVASILFAILGFIIAFLLILKIQLN